ncbi:MAG: gamma-glutamyl-gamma-aminobutyrate hydrolase family protein [Planctomycetota bacterium]|nr:MAG: gamma-glutamyl-gamma-aminobutyrate hydrolase family protein [Planctomycetota bacterium]
MSGDGPPLRLGLSCSVLPPDPERNLFKNRPLVYVEQSMVDWLLSSGQRVYLVPFERPALHRPERIAAWIDDLDGLVLTGGTDLAPESYGERPRDPAWAGDPERDAYELALVRRALETATPVFGVCRGLQLLNVALGGTLYQDIATDRPGARVHRDPGPYHRLEHEVEIVAGSGLHALYGTTRGRVNSVHHQGIRDLGAGLAVEARCPEDGVIESVRLVRSPAHPRAWAHAVQWHPEFQEPGDTHLLAREPLLDAFVDACRRRRDERESRP